MGFARGSGRGGDHDEGAARLPSALLAFALLLAVALLLFAFTSWLEGVSDVWRLGPAFWIARLDLDSALDTLSNAAEVVAAVLAIAITVVAIVVELAANRYTHSITQLFIRDPVNAAVMGFLVLTTVQCLWVSATLDGADPGAARLPFAGVALSMGMVSLSLLILLPYFAYVFAFLSPLNVVNRIRDQALGMVRRNQARFRARLRSRAVESVEELEDVARSAIEHRDRGIAVSCVDALTGLVEDYGELRAALPGEWFRIDGRLARDPDFVSMDRVALDEILENRLWLELKVLRQFHSLFTEAVNRVRDVAYLIALDTRRIAHRASQRHPELFELSVRFFNSYLRAAINGADVRTAYYVLHQYRQLAEDTLGQGRDGRAVEIAEHFRFYGLLSHERGQSFLLEAVAYDLAHLVEAAIRRGAPEADALLDVLLQVDKESESRDQETSLRGVRRAQVQLATFFLAQEDEARARRIYQDMARERDERLQSIRDELLAEKRPLYWEFTDRGINFAYLPPDRRAKLGQFFAWFGERLASDARVGRSGGTS